MTDRIVMCVLFAVVATVAAVAMYGAGNAIWEAVNPERRAYLVECMESGKRHHDCAQLWRLK